MASSVRALATRERRRAGWGGSALTWLRAHDRGLLALRRAARTAIVMPIVLAITAEVIGDPVTATFSAFGCFAMMLLVDFSGAMRDRLQAQATLVLACGVLIALATLASRSAVLAAAVTAVVAFAVLFSGVVSSVLAGATTSLLLAFVLPVSLPGAPASIPDRLAGWGLAGGASLLAISLLWPAPANDGVRRAAALAARTLANRLRAQIDYVTQPGADELQAAHIAAIAAADAAVASLHDLFFATPYRPTGLSTADRAVVRLVDELRWLNTVVLQSRPGRHPIDPGPHVCAVKRAAADVLEEVAGALITPGADCHRLGERTTRLRAALAELEQGTTMRLPQSVPSLPRDAMAAAVVSALDPTFRAQELSFVVAQVARNTEYVAAAERRSWLDRLLGRQPEGLIGPVAAAQERAGAHVQRHSIWLHNSLRGAAGLALAVLVADLSAVSHGFWVIFGALSVLRSNALSTGQNVVRALLGTTVGFLVGAALVLLIGTNTVVLWALLPFVILLAGLAPAAISFAAGQAAFTLTLLILFNILAPAGWRIGLVRIEDVALGGAVSLVVGILFWPRGAAAALGAALADAYRSSIAYLSDAVSYGIGRCDASSPPVAAPGASAARAAAASRRLDDAFRGYLADRGSKPIPLPEVTSLVTGVSGVRLAADAVIELWGSDRRDTGDRAAARAELLTRMHAMSSWYDTFAAGLAAGGSVPAPLVADAGGDERLVSAVRRDLRDPEGQGTVTGVRVIWTGDHLDAVRRLQGSLIAPARTAAAEHIL